MVYDSDTEVIHSLTLTHSAASDSIWKSQFSLNKYILNVHCTVQTTEHGVPVEAPTVYLLSTIYLLVAVELAPDRPALPPLGARAEDEAAVSTLEGTACYLAAHDAVLYSCYSP